MSSWSLLFHGSASLSSTLHHHRFSFPLFFHLEFDVHVAFGERESEMAFTCFSVTKEEYVATRVTFWTFLVEVILKSYLSESRHIFKIWASQMFQLYGHICQCTSEIPRFYGSYVKSLVIIWVLYYYWNMMGKNNQISDFWCSIWMQSNLDLIEEIIVLVL